MWEYRTYTIVGHTAGKEPGSFVLNKGLRDSAQLCIGKGSFSQLVSDGYNLSYPDALESVMMGEGQR